MGRSILFLILLFVFPLSACSHKSSAPVSADTMPDMEELLAYSQSHSQEEYEKKLKEIQALTIPLMRSSARSLPIPWLPGRIHRPIMRSPIPP